MALANVTVASISGIIAEFGPERFVSTINNMSPLIGSGVLEKVEQDGEELTVTADVGESPATTYASDFDNRPNGQTTTPVKARFIPTMVTTRVSLGKQASLAKLADRELTKMLDAKLDASAKSVARHIGRGLYAGAVVPQAVATWSGTAADSTVTISFLDVSLFIPGASYNFVDTSGVLSYTIRCTGKTASAVGANSANVAGTVSFINDVINPATGSVVALGATAVAVDDILALRGTYPGFGGNATAIAGKRLNSFDDIAGSGASSSFGGISPANLPGWTGQTIALSAAYSHEAALQFDARITQYSGEQFTDALMSPQVAAAHRIQAGAMGAVFGMTIQPTAQRPQPLGARADKYGDVRNSGLDLAGRPVLIDPNCPQTIVVFHNRDHAKLGCWSEMAPEELTELGGVVVTNRATLSMDADFTGSYQLYCAKRAAIGVMTGLTGL
jgi:hypothetical protein